MEVGDGPRKKQTARVVPVVLGFNDFCARVGNKLPCVDLQTLTYRRKIREITFFEILVEVRDGRRRLSYWGSRQIWRGHLGAIHQIHRLSKAKRDMIANPARGRIGGLVGDQFDHIQPKLA